MAGKSKVIILCCNRLLRESIARILSKKVDFEIVASQPLHCLSWEEISESGADVVVLDSMDLLLEGSQPVSPAAISRLRRCVLVAMEDDHGRFLRAIRRGAQGYVLQDASAADVVSAIRAVAEGQAACPPQYIRVLMEYVASQTAELPDNRKRAQWGLTRREQQLVPLIGRGLSNKEIANHLNLSEQTIKNHVHRILRKVGVADRLRVFEVCQSQPSSSY